MVKSSITDSVTWHDKLEWHGHADLWSHHKCYQGIANLCGRQLQGLYDWSELHMISSKTTLLELEITKGMDGQPAHKVDFTSFGNTSKHAYLVC